MKHHLPEGMHEVGWVADDAFLQIDQLLKIAAPNTERLSCSKVAGCQLGGFSAEQEESLEAITAPFVADFDTPFPDLSLGIDLRGQGYYGRPGPKRRSFWHSEGSSRSTTNIGHLGTWFLVDRRPTDPNAELRGLTGSMLIKEYGIDPNAISTLTAEDLAVAGLTIYQDVPGRIVDYSGIIHRVPGCLYDDPDCGQRIFARVSVY